LKSNLFLTLFFKIFVLIIIALDLPEKNAPPRDKNFCEFKGRKIAIGEEIYDNCRAVCHCGHDARLNCAAIECPHNFAPHVSDCLEWDIDPHFIPTPPNCCPQPKCKNGNFIFNL
jgi:hypothetical protein